MKKEEYWDKTCYGKDRSNEMPHWGGNLIYFVTYSIGKILWRFNIQHREKLRKFMGKSGILLVSNHISFLDVYCMYCCVRFKQWVRFVGRDSLFEHKILGRLLCWAGAFPIKRDTADMKALKRAARMLKNQEIVGILPEGTRRGKSDRKPTLHSGAAFIARLGGNVPIVPMTCRNADKVKVKGERLRFPKISVDFGDPILLSDFNCFPKNQRLEVCTWYAMRETFALARQVDPTEIDMKEMFPDTHDYTKEVAKANIPRRTADEVIAMIDEKNSDK